MNIRRWFTYVAVTDTYQQQCGEAGVLEVFRNAFSECVAANGGYAAKLESWTPLSLKETKAIGLTKHPETTWYRIEGSGVEGRLVGASVH